MDSSMDNAREVRRAIDTAIMDAGALSGRRIDPRVAAVITVESDLRYFPATMEGLFHQSVLPGTILIAECAGAPATLDVRAVGVAEDGLTFRRTANRGGQGGRGRIPTPAEGEIAIAIASIDGAQSFTDAVGRVLDRTPPPQETTMLWLLHDDSRPEPTCLEELLRVRENTPTVSLIGAKQLDWTGERLRNVGYYAAPGHRVSSFVVDGEPDQEQYDERQDVFAVSLSGALVMLAEWNRLSGGNPHVGTFADSRDLCRRVCLSGGRVVVAPRARICHVRARYTGIRTAAGTPITRHRAARTYPSLQRARDIYLYSDVPRRRWASTWLYRLLASWGLFFKLLARKKPFGAACELVAPWRDLASLPAFSSVRRGVVAATASPRPDLRKVERGRDAVKQWRMQCDLTGAGADEPANQLVEGYLGDQAALRRRWAAIMTLVALAAGLAANWSLLRGVFSGSQALSSSLLPTGATLSQLARAATSGVSYAAGLGVGAPPAPFLLVLLGCSVLTGGHVAWAVAAIILLAAPLSALSFWALAGIVTRSNPVRVLASLAWVCLGMMTGLYSQGNLPMLTVSVFLPAGIAFVFKSVGMYRTEDRAFPRPSAQSAAWASLCLAVAVAAEPQLCVALVLSFVLFLLAVRSHRSVLLMTPLPAAIAIAPTLVACAAGRSGGWRQLFGDIMIPSSASAAQGSLVDSLLAALGRTDDATAFTRWAATAAAVMMGCLAVLAVISLLQPSTLRVSRMMGTLGVCGILLAILSASTPIGQDEGGVAYGSILPGLFLTVMALLAGTCMTAGTAAAPFVTYVDSSNDPVSSLAVMGRVLLCVLLALTALSWGVVGLRVVDDEPLSVSDAGLPMVAGEYLSQDESHRILAVRADSGVSASFALMRTARGDLIDSSPAVRATEAQEGMDATDRRIAGDVMSLMAGPDSQASADLESLGLGGVYVADAGSVPGAMLVANLLAASNTQQVLDKDGGVYLRFTTLPTAEQGIDTGAEDRTLGGARRAGWITAMAVTLIIYGLVALPTGRRRGQGVDFDD